MMAVCVDPKRVSEVWPHFRHYIDSAINKVGLNSPQTIEADVLSGRALLWLAYDGKLVHAAAVTEIVDKVCTIVACGGDGLDDFLPCMISLEQFARDEGCTAMRIIGRDGWQRILKNYKQKAVILERQL